VFTTTILDVQSVHVLRHLKYNEVGNGDKQDILCQMATEGCATFLSLILGMTNSIDGIGKYPRSLTISGLFVSESSV
jgi:hypothetical protein